MPPSFSSLTEAAIEIATKAGNFLKDSFHLPHQVLSKEGKKNLVTECDIASEEMILSFLRSKFPLHRFLSEEQGSSGKQGSEIIWVIDPLDGTVNFTYQIPFFSISIAACQGEEVLCGVIYVPMTHELFVAEKGKGAFLNGVKLQVSREQSASQALLAIEIPYDYEQDPDASIRPFVFFLRHGISLRRLGSAALNLAYVAAGRFDAFFEKALFPWDVAAGILLVEEAGGKVSDGLGRKRDPFSQESLLASNALIHEEMIQSIQGKEPRA